MAEYLRLARLYLLLLGIVTVGRWLQSIFGMPYEKGHQIFSIVILTYFSCLYYAAFCRRWRGFRIFQAIVLGLILGLISQVVVLLSTLASYALGIATYFTHPIALNVEDTVPVGRAMAIRLGGLVFNTIASGIAGALGWAFGGLLPESK